MNIQEAKTHLDNIDKGFCDLSKSRDLQDLIDAAKCFRDSQAVTDRILGEIKQILRYHSHLQVSINVLGLYACYSVALMQGKDIIKIFRGENIEKQCYLALQELTRITKGK